VTSRNQKEDSEVTQHSPAVKTSVEVEC